MAIFSKSWDVIVPGSPLMNDLRDEETDATAGEGRSKGTSKSTNLRKNTIDLEA
jgi:hypothetical protein